MALKAVLVVVANRRMAWTVVGLSSSSSLCFFSCPVLLCFCFLLRFLTVLLSCLLRWRLLAGGIAVGGNGGSSPLCAEYILWLLQPEDASVFLCRDGVTAGEISVVDMAP
uniref:Uncharacterized protein n=1 Tax=Populus alba TaxID=43335 RepID=A0A4U5P1U1_POPAL|nr:hypothetical protein D5086_0000238130 [Populus alba]